MRKLHALSLLCALAMNYMKVYTYEVNRMRMTLYKQCIYNFMQSMGNCMHIICKLLIAIYMVGSLYDTAHSLRFTVEFLYNDNYYFAFPCSSLLRYRCNSVQPQLMLSMSTVKTMTVQCRTLRQEQGD